MTEPGLSDVYDLFYPSPPTLKELASIEVAVDLWRREIIEHRINNTLEDLDLKSNLPLSTLIPNTSTVYLTMVEKFALRVGSSIESWLQFHMRKALFRFEILKNFADFVCDFDGKIHYKRTAKRMMLCDGISDDMKFKIACLNCFEDEVLEFWPSVSSRVSMKEMDLIHYSQTCSEWGPAVELPNMTLKESDMKRYPTICYWICRLKNQLNEIPGLSEYGGSVDEMLSEKVSDYWPSLEYFLNRINPDTRSKQIIKLIKSDSDSSSRSSIIFCRHLLTKLDESELRILLASEEVCNTLIYYSLVEFSRYEVEVAHVLRAWSYVKNFTPANEFVTLIHAILRDHIRNTSHSKEDYPALCEIWTSASNHLKQAVHSSILKDRSFVHIDYYGECGEFGGFVTFLLAVLSDAAIEVRKKFWKRNWHMLMCNKTAKDLERLMNLCFSDKTEIEQFKATRMSKYEEIKEYVEVLIYEFQIEALNEFLLFCCNGDEQAVNDLKLQILTEDLDFDGIQIVKPNLVNQFINDAYGPNVRLACHLKKQLFDQSKPSIEKYLKWGKFKNVMQFVDAFAVSQKRADECRNYEIANEIRSLFETEIFREMSKEAGDDLAPFMSWLLRGDDKTAQFKKALSVDCIVENQITKQPSWEKFSKDELGRRIRKSKTTYDYFFIKFLEWYFVTDEALEQFKAKYADNDVFVELTTM